MDVQLENETMDVGRGKRIDTHTPFAYVKTQTEFTSFFAMVNYVPKLSLDYECNPDVGKTSWPKTRINNFNLLDQMSSSLDQETTHHPQVSKKS